jgi:hypothetical protein
MGICRPQNASVAVRLGEPELARSRHAAGRTEQLRRFRQTYYALCLFQMLEELCIRVAER